MVPHNENKRICIQIGLGHRAEYVYLTNPRWRELRLKQKNLKQIPDVLCELDDNRLWHYYGIDGSLGSILFCMARYSFLPHEQKEHLNWICAPIADSLNFYPSSYLYFKNPSVPSAPEMYYTRQNQTFILGAPFDWIIQKLNIKEIDMIAVDIEGFENILFFNYSWRIRPKFIAIEYHDKWNHVRRVPTSIDLAEREKLMGNELAKFIQTQGYKLIRREGTNSRYRKYAKTMELQFLREDLCD